ncbi:MAG: hypothetical protein IKD69_09790, partial [Solobacterium sp.]|nr:hypothetical protein [Solobacterium sp.]
MPSLNEKKEKSPYEQSTPLWITTVLLAGFLLITVLKAGAVGKFLYNLLRYLFGQYYPEIVILFIIWRLANNWFKKNGLPRISTAALLLFICDLQLIFTLVMAGFLEAMPDTLMEYLRSLPQYLNSVTEEEVT